MAFNNEIEKTEGEIKVLQAKLELLKEMENHKSPAEEAYKAVYGWHPPTTPSVSNYEDNRWSAFQNGYNASKVGETPQEQEDMVAELKGETLYDICMTWWERVFGNTDDTETCIDDLVDNIDYWLPKEQSAAGSQNAYVECSVEGFNDCLNKIKRKLR